jgi:transposase
MENEYEITPNDVGEPSEIIATLQQEVKLKEHEIEYLKERVALLTQQLYGKKSEKLQALSEAEQLPLFSIDEAEKNEESADVETVSVAAHKKKKPGRKPLPSTLARREVIHDISDEDKICGCGSALSQFGAETSEKLNYVPATLEVIRHIRPKYACRSCEGTQDEGTTVKIAPLHPQILPKSLAAPGLLAHIVTAKFADSLPLYRQEKQFARLGLDLSRATMSGWLIRLSDACEKIMDLLKKEILAGPLINIDETTIQVLDEKDRSPSTKSYMWVLRGGPPGNHSVLFHYDESRAGRVAEDLLEGYRGVVQCDGFSGYGFLDALPEVFHAGCWAHARRKFMEVSKALGKAAKGKKASDAQKALTFIGKVYAIEKKAKALGLSAEDIEQKRMLETKPLLEQFHQWLLLKLDQTPPKGLLGKALAYTLNQWPRLIVFLDHGFMTPDNNLAENAIRPFVVGRKNWLFSKTPKGAKATAVLYSLVESAKACGLEPYKYLTHLFEHLPEASTEAQIKKLLPQNVHGDPAFSA